MYIAKVLVALHCNWNFVIHGSLVMYRVFSRHWNSS